MGKWDITRFRLKIHFRRVSFIGQPPWLPKKDLVCLWYTYKNDSSILNCTWCGRLSPSKVVCRHGNHTTRNVAPTSNADIMQSYNAFKLIATHERHSLHQISFGVACRAVPCCVVGHPMLRMDLVNRYRGRGTRRRLPASLGGALSVWFTYRTCKEKGCLHSKKACFQWFQLTESGRYKFFTSNLNCEQSRW